MLLHAATPAVLQAIDGRAESRRHPLDRLGLGAVPELLPPAVVDEAIEECGRREARVRALPARVTLYFILALWFYPAAGYAEVLRMLFRQIRAQVVTGRWRIPSVAAVVQARRRLGPAPLKALLRRLRRRHRVGLGRTPAGLRQRDLRTAAFPEDRARGDHDRADRA